MDSEQERRLVVNIENIRNANLPLSDSNRYVAGEAECRFNGRIHNTMKFVENFQLLDVEHWKRFAEQFRIHSDDYEPNWPTNGWRGEYWGKMMRGASLVYAYTKNKELYQVLTDSVEDLMTCSEESGRISSYPISDEFTGWDMWCRKYVLLGMEYYLEICQDEIFAKRVVKCMCRQLDYIMSKIGAEEGKLPINKASGAWRGLNASSILEPVVRLYNLTHEERYLDFAEYIVNEGGTEIVNVFQLAYENQFYPFQYPVTKAYELTSCFEGLLEYYRVKKIEWHKTALIHFADRILESDFTVIGSSGCTHELLDHSTVRQANPTDAMMQETCVTVTLMKFFYQMTLLTGNAAYADAFECSMYNAYLGAVNTEKCNGPDMRTLYCGAYPESIPEVLPFDSYSPLTAGTRGNGIGGAKMMPDHHYYGCCACIGAAGIGMVPKMALMKSEDGIVMNLYISGSLKTKTPEGQTICFTMDTEYPKHGQVHIRIEVEREERFTITLRNPAWSKEIGVRVNGSDAATEKGYIVLDRTWAGGDWIELTFDMRTEVIRPIPYGHEILMTNMVGWKLDYVIPVYDIEDENAKNHISLRRGPLVLAADSQFGYDASQSFDICVNENGYVDAEFPETDISVYEHMTEMLIPMKNGEKMRVTDYGSAGKQWSAENKIAAWIRIV